jgi:glutathione S-transferase
MRLYISPTSPFARKCRITAREKGLADRIEEIVADPYANDPALVAVNPIVQVPALVDDAGAMFTDSPLICAYLDTMGEGPLLLPMTVTEHWRVRRLEAVADGLTEMGVKMTLELRRPESERSPAWLMRWRDGLMRALDALEAQLPGPETLDLSTLSAVCALTWFDLRHPALDWRQGRPGLTALQAGLESRDSFKATVPG